MIVNGPICDFMVSNIGDGEMRKRRLKILESAIANEVTRQQQDGTLTAVNSCVHPSVDMCLPRLLGHSTLSSCCFAETIQGR